MRHAELQHGAFHADVGIGRRRGRKLVTHAGVDLEGRVLDRAEIGAHGNRQALPCFDVLALVVLEVDVRDVVAAVIEIDLAEETDARTVVRRRVFLRPGSDRQRRKHEQASRRELLH